MAFDFDSNIDISSFDEICDYEDIYRNLVEQINKAVTDIHKPDRNKSLQYATLCRDPKGNWYIDCYKSNWDRYKDIHIYHAVWKIIKDNFTACCSLRWKLNPYLSDILLALDEYQRSPLFMSEACMFTNTQNEVRISLDIPFIKEAMDFMYGNSYFRKTDYVHTIKLCHAATFNPLLKNSCDELSEFVSWIKDKIKVPKSKSKWIVDTTNFIFTDEPKSFFGRRHNKKGIFQLIEQKLADNNEF